MTDTATLGAAAFLAKLMHEKSKFTPLYMEIECPKCGYKTHDSRPFIINSWLELLPKNKILCPMCGTPMKMTRASMKMNGGGGVSASDDAPAITGGQP